LFTVTQPLLLLLLLLLPYGRPRILPIVSDPARESSPITRFYVGFILPVQQYS